MTIVRALILAAALAASISHLRAQGAFRIEEVASLADADPARIEPGTILFSDHRKVNLNSSNSTCIFEDVVIVKTILEQ